MVDRQRYSDSDRSSQDSRLSENMIILDLYAFIHKQGRINNFILLFITLLYLLTPTLALYEDQVGKFDWKQSYVGRIKMARLEPQNGGEYPPVGRRLIVATEENAVAAINLKNGQILWRQIFEGSSQGNIHMLYVGDETVTITGNSPTLVRGWDSATGLLMWEWSLWLQSPEGDFLGHWWVDGNQLHHLLPIYKKHLEVTSYNLRTGQNRGASSKFPAPWTNEKCVFASPYYTCLSEEFPGQLISLDVTGDIAKLQTLHISQIFSEVPIPTILQPLPGILPSVLLNGRVILLSKDGLKKTHIQMREDTTSVYCMKYGDSPVIVQAFYADESLQITAVNSESGGIVTELSNIISLPGANNPMINSVICSKTAKNNLACRMLVVGEDDAVYLVQNPGKLLWTREESLSNIIGVEMLDLPISEMDAVIEREFDNKEADLIMELGDIFGMASRRIKGQLLQMKNLIQTMLLKYVPPLDRKDGDDSEDYEPLVRDEFGLHKIILTITNNGKIFAIDNLSGKIIWKRYIPFLSPFKSQPSSREGRVVIYLQRSTRHLPYDAQCVILAKHKFTGEGILFMFNPITGAATDMGIANLGYRIKQTLLLNQMNAEFIKGVLVMDEHDNIHVYPPSCSEQVHNLFMFVAEPQTAVVQGYSIDKDGKKVKAMNIWTLRLGGSPNSGHVITNVATKNPIERVHSQGKVMGDRSVLYKYINPNLVAFTTEGPDPVHKDVLNIFLVDVISGSIIFVQSHRKARGPVKIVHSENWLVYSYFNDKSRRSEIATVELYDGPERSEGSSFSSLRNVRLLPDAARQAYILPAPSPPLALSTTITDRGITAKDVLVSLSSGSILELPWVILDPRRPTVPMTNEMREEGLLQYTPELPIPSEAIINYNQTLNGIRNIHTSPSGLESTCLVFAYGLDIFFTRVAPSKTFDLLKEDFDYFLIVIVLGALIVASYAAKKFASRKLLRQAWK